MHPIAPAFALALAALAASAAPPVAPPVAEARPVTSTYHGTTVTDPYRWLEDKKSPPVQAWLRGQADAARQVLDRIDGRDAIATRLAELADAQGDSIRSLRMMPGERFYYLKRSPGQRQFRLVMREGVAGAEKLLVDPEAIARRTGVPHAINYFHPSWDGRYLAYGLSAGGSEDASLHLLDIASGQPVGAPVPRVHQVQLSWLPDSRALTFNQLRELPAGAHATETYLDTSVMLMPVGGTPKPVFGPTVTRSLKLERLDVGQILTVPGSRWAVARTTDTTVPEGKLFVLPLADLGKAGAKWRRIGGPEHKVVSVALQGDLLAVLTQAGAPLRKIVGVDLQRGTLADAKLLVAEPKEAVIEGFALTPTGLVTEVRQGTQRVLRRHARGDTVGTPLPAPAAGTANLASAPAHHTDALAYSFSGWTEPSRLLRLDGDKSVELPIGRRVVPPGLPEVQVTDVLVPSHDGVKVPMTILHRKGLALDGRNPVLLNGYGAYGSTISARFSTEDMAWIERGGVLAFVNPRGSGVYGDAWHRAGFKTTKPNTWKDGIAAAKYLIAQGYGSAKTLGISGTSAGGIFVGRATTEAPELFAAAIYNVGVMDTLRAEESANGITNISEFGSVKDPAEFKALLAMSTYHAIQDGTRYPGVLLMHGMNDPRVEVSESAKAAARLQAAQAGVPDARPALLRVDMQAGHGVGSTVTQRQSQTADMHAFLLWQMGKLGLKD
ncbi:MAG: prolyl oligopeptidase family serine peptidase [Rubrivivax sp.]|nr:prolyl oligopeptidase family serine peptidase [Rubrivivax sp.]